MKPLLFFVTIFFLGLFGLTVVAHAPGRCDTTCTLDDSSPPAFEGPGSYREVYINCKVLNRNQSEDGCWGELDLLEHVDAMNMSDAHYIHFSVLCFSLSMRAELHLSHYKYPIGSRQATLTDISLDKCVVDYADLEYFGRVTSLTMLQLIDVTASTEPYRVRGGTSHDGYSQVPSLAEEGFSRIYEFVYRRAVKYGEIEQVRPLLNLTLPNATTVALVNISISDTDLIMLEANWPNIQSLQVAEAGLGSALAFPWVPAVRLTNPYGYFRSKIDQAHYTLDGLLDLDRQEVKQCLDQRFNQITELVDCQFGRESFLHVIRFAHNLISHIDERCFQNRRELQFLDLSDNRISSLSPGMFDGLDNLRKLDLSSNLLRDVSGQFRSLTQLRQLSLANNRIHNLLPGTLDPLASLKVLFMSNNMLQVLDHDAFKENIHLEEVYLNHNNLTDIPTSALLSRNLQHIDMANNSVDFSSLKIYNSAHSPTHLLYYRAPNVDDALFNKDQTNNLRSFQKPRIILRNNHVKIKFPPRRFYINRTLLLLFSLFTFQADGAMVVCNVLALRARRDLEKRFESTVDLPVNREDFSTWRCGEPSITEGTPYLDLAESQFFTQKASIYFCPAEATCYEGIQGVILVECYDCGLTSFPEQFPYSDDDNLTAVFVNNDLETLPAAAFLGNVTSLVLRNNRMQTIVDEAMPLMGNLRELDLSDNQFYYLPEGIQNLDLQHLKMSGNQWPCDCTQTWMKFWLLRLHAAGRVENVLEIVCRSGPQIGKSLITLEDTDFVCPEKHDAIVLIASLVAMSAVLVILLLGLLLLYKYFTEIKILLFVKFNLHPFDKIDDSDPDKEYDAFISYSSLDNHWVLKTLRPALEQSIRPPMRVCIHERDFRVGQAIIDNIFESVKKSRRMIVVVSKNFVTSDWCMLEFRAAHEKVLKDLKAYMIMILLDDVDEEDLDESMRAYLSTNTYLHVKNKWFWDKLLYSLPQLQKPRLEGTLPATMDNLEADEEAKEATPSVGVDVDMDKLSAVPASPTVISSVEGHDNECFEAEPDDVLSETPPHSRTVLA